MTKVMTRKRKPVIKEMAQIINQDTNMNKYNIQ